MEKRATKTEREERLYRIVSLRAKGYTFEDIGNNPEINISERQVRKEWNRHEGRREDLANHLIQRQIAQIESLVPAEDYKSKLQYRADLIWVLQPKAARRPIQ